MNTKVDEGKLISGKEALIALANDQDVEFFYRDVWDSIGEMIVIDHFMSDKFKFRLKPQALTVNGIEVPSVRYIAHSGGNCVKISCHCPEDARVINAALRQVFGCSHDN